MNTDFDAEIRVGLVAYALVAILTFGHAVNRISEKFPVDAALIGSVGCAIGWPLYWSAVLFEVRKK